VLGRVWAAGARLYRARGWIDGAHGAASWRDALAWLGARDGIAELQYWGHGKWGSARCGDEVLDASVLAPGPLDALRAQLRPDALVWFRTCETLGARAGHDFAARAADRLGARIAGHTYVIAYYQSGLHVLAPGARPDWPAHEGLVRGTAAAPERAARSSRRAPRTITALTPRLPSRVR